MKIAYVIDYLYGITGGTERQLYSLIEGMISRGHEIELYIFTETDFTRTLSDFPCPVYLLGISSISSVTSFRKLWKFRKALIDNKVDVVHGFFNDVALILPPLMIGSGIKTYTSRRDMGIWYTNATLFFLRLFRFTKTKLICNCLAVAKYTQEKEWKCQENILVIYNGMDRHLTTESADVFSWVPEKAESSGVINVILVANVRPVKRIEDLIMAAVRLLGKEYRITYYLVGHLQDKLYCDFLRELIRRYQLEEDFHFVGSISEPRVVLDRFDIGVLTSASEGFSNTIMEYLDAGLSVVASRVGGNPELITDNQNGLLYETGDDKALAECLHKLAGDVKLRQSFSACAKNTVRQFDNVTMVEHYEKEYMYDWKGNNQI